MSVVVTVAQLVVLMVARSVDLWVAVMVVLLADLSVGL